MDMIRFKPKYPLPAGLPEDCEDYDLACIKTPGFSDKPEVLFVIGHVDRGDLKSGTILSTSPSQDVFRILLDDSAAFYKRATGKKVKPYEMAVVNYNYHKNYHLKGDQSSLSRQSSLARINKIISSLKPKLVVVFGREAAFDMLGGDDVSSMQYGMVRDYSIKDFNCKFLVIPSFHNTYPNLDDDATEDEYDAAVLNANSIGYISRCLSSMYEGKMLISKDVQPKYELIKTIDRANALLDKLMSHKKPIAYDCETGGLFSYKCKILTLQFAFSEKQGYIIPLDHMDAKWTKEEKRHLLKRFREFFSKKPTNKDNYLVGQNLAFDFRMAKQRFKLPIIYWNCWDVMGGEHVLDENLGRLPIRLKGERSPGAYRLDKINLRYGIPWYATATFGKSDRVTISSVPLDNDVCDYCFREDVIVETDIGPIPIKELASNFIGRKALSYNHETGVAEYRDITASSETVPTEDLIQLEYEGGTLTVTESHEVWCVNKDCYIAVRDIELDDEVLIYKET